MTKKVKKEGFVKLISKLFDWKILKKSKFIVRVMGILVIIFSMSSYFIYQGPIRRMLLIKSSESIVFDGLGWVLNTVLAFLFYYSCVFFLNSFYLLKKRK